MKQKILNSLVVIIGFLLYRNSKYFFAYCVFGLENWRAMDANLTVSCTMGVGMVIALAGTWYILKKPSVTALGLRGSFIKVCYGLPVYNTHVHWLCRHRQFARGF